MGTYEAVSVSRIFDALQRSESERSGVDLSALSAATEVLQLAELRAVSERKAATQVERPGQTDSLEHNRSVPLQAVWPEATALESHGPAEVSLNEKHLDMLAKCRSLKVSVPPQNQLVCLTDSESLAAEKFRFLGVRLRQLRRERPLQKVLITSTIPGEGKSMVAANLACTLARKRQQSTLLLEGDVRRPSLSQMFGLGRMPGICEWLQGDQSEAKNIYHLEGAGLWFLPAGNALNNPLELLQSGKLSALMDQLTMLFDWVIVDSPPVLPLADTSVWSRLVDGILLVARQGTTKKRSLQRGLEAIDHQKLIGTLLNCARSPAHSDDYYYYHPSTALRSENPGEK